MQQFPLKIQGIIWFLISRLGLVFLIVSSRYLAEDLRPIEIAALQNLFALIFFIPIFYKRGFKKVVKTKRLPLHVFRGFIAVAGIVIWYYAFTKIPLADAVAINYSLPLITTIFAIFLLKEKVNFNTWIALTIGFMGLLVIIRPGFQDVSHVYLLVIAATSCWALSDILNKFLLTTDSSETIVFYMSLTALLFTLPFTIYQFSAITIVHIILFVSMGIMSNVAYITTSLAYSKNKTIAYLQPFDFIRLVFVIIASYFIFAETIDFLAVLGVIIILGSNQMLFVSKQNEQELIKAKDKVQALMEKQRQFFMFIIAQLKDLTKSIGECASSVKMCKDSPKTIDDLAKIITQVNNDTIDLVDRINDLNNMEQKNLEIKKTQFNLSDLISDVIKDKTYKAKDLDIIIDFKKGANSDIMVKTDKNVLSRILKGLLTNCLDIANVCTEILITLEEKEHEIHLKIVDDRVEDDKKSEEKKDIKDYSNQMIKFNNQISSELAKLLKIKLSFNKLEDLNETVLIFQK
jgi:drug/metabolite transporter (DMT)-like permease